MPPALRLLLAFLAAWGTWWLMNIAFAFFPIFRWPVQQAVVGLCALVLASALWWATRPDAQTSLLQIIRTALQWGLISFALGFFGPMVLAPGANQGPMLGFFTGPAGLAAGGIYAFVRALLGRNQAADDAAP